MSMFSFKLSGCDGLEAGHGQNPALGLYQCYGLVRIYLKGVT